MTNTYRQTKSFHFADKHLSSATLPGDNNDEEGKQAPGAAGIVNTHNDDKEDSNKRLISLATRGTRTTTPLLRGVF